MFKKTKYTNIDIGAIVSSYLFTKKNSKNKSIFLFAKFWVKKNSEKRTDIYLSWTLGIQAKKSIFRKGNYVTHTHTHSKKYRHQTVYTKRNFLEVHIIKMIFHSKVFHYFCSSYNHKLTVFRFFQFPQNQNCLKYQKTISKTPSFLFKAFQKRTTKKKKQEKKKMEQRYCFKEKKLP